MRRHRITSVLSAAVGNPNGPPNVLSGVKNPTQQRESFTRGVKFLWRNLQTARMQKRGRVTERERERRLLAMSAFLWRHPTTSVLSPPVGNPNGPPIQQKETFTRGVNTYGATSKSPACRKEEERERERNAYLWCRSFLTSPHHFGSHMKKKMKAPTQPWQLSLAQLKSSGQLSSAKLGQAQLSAMQNNSKHISATLRKLTRIKSSNEHGHPHDVKLHS